MISPRIPFFYLVLLAVLAGTLAQAVHETGHLLVYQAYGRQPTWGFTGLVQMWDDEPLDPDRWVRAAAPDGSGGWLRLASSPDGRIEKLLGAAAGPLASLAAALLGLWIAIAGRNPAWRHVGLMFCLATAFGMTAYYLRSPLRSFGDEAEVASQLGIAKGTIELVLGSAFALCLAFCLDRLDSWLLRGRWLLAAVLGSAAAGVLLNLTDPLVRILVDRDHPLFRPALGLSLPVLLVYLLAVLGVLVWAWKVRRRLSPARPD